MTSHAAYLRVYEPLAAFAPDVRRRWEAYAAAGQAPSTAIGPAIERAAAVQALVGRPPSTLPRLAEQAYVLDVDGVTLVCPWSTRLRSLQALEDFLADLPAEVADAYVPRALADGVGEALDGWREENPEQRSWQLSATWHVPLPWFVLVDSAEREVRLGEASPAGTRRVAERMLLYRTPMSRARRRVARALAVLRRHVEEGVITASVEDLGRWLEEFHPRSLVELDYGGLVHLLDDAELQQDESARDIALALAALAEQDPERASSAYERVSARMKALQAVESAN